MNVVGIHLNLSLEAQDGVEFTILSKCRQCPRISFATRIWIYAVVRNDRHCK